MKRAANAIYDMPIVTVRSDLIDKPRFKLADNVPVTPEYRAEFNAWAREFFGGEFPILRHQDQVSGRVQLLMSEDTLRHEMRKFSAEVAK
jgi:hypothetical protein